MNALFTQRRFGPFFLTQFLGAFNDNLYKTAMLLLIVYKLRPEDAQGAAVLSQMAAAIFILPFLLFSLWAGTLADKLDKAFLIRIIKAAEILIMVVGAWGLMQGHLPLLFAALFAMGVHSAFFGPIKYAILPQHVEAEHLAKATASVEAGTFLAILTGQLAAGLLPVPYIMGVVVMVTLLGYVCAHFIPPAPPPVRFSLPGLSDRDALLDMVRDPTMRGPIVHISLFWALGLVITTQLPPLVRSWLMAPQQLVTLYLTLFSIGVGVGALWAVRILPTLSRKKMVNSAALTIGCILLMLYFILLIFDPRHTVDASLAHALWWLVGALLSGLAIAAGLYIVPLYLHVQQAPPAHLRAQWLGVNNLSNAAFMVVASLIAAGAQAMGLDTAELVLGAGIFWLAFFLPFRLKGILK